MCTSGLESRFDYWPNMITSSFLDLCPQIQHQLLSQREQTTYWYILYLLQHKGRLLSLNTDENTGSGPTGAGWIVHPRQDLLCQGITVQRCPQELCFSSNAAFRKKMMSHLSHLLHCDSSCLPPCGQCGLDFTYTWLPCRARLFDSSFSSWSTSSASEISSNFSWRQVALHPKGDEQTSNLSSSHIFGALAILERFLAKMPGKRTTQNRDVVFGTSLLLSLAHLGVISRSYHLMSPWPDKLRTSS